MFRTAKLPSVKRAQPQAPGPPETPMDLHATTCPCTCHTGHLADCSINGGCGHLHRTTTSDCITPACQQRRPGPRRVLDGYRVCRAHADQLRDDLTGIPDRWAVLDAPDAILRPTGDGGRRAPGFAAAAPANLTIIVLHDPRTVSLGRGDLHNPTVVLASWVDLVLTAATGHTEPVDVGGACTLLLRWADFVLRQDWCGDLIDEVHEIHTQLGTLTGVRRPRPIGHCRTLLDDRTCGHPLWLPTHGDTVECRGCGREWPRREWQMLGRVLLAS